MADLPLIDANPDRLDDTLVPQFQKRFPATVHCLFENFGLFIAAGEPVDVMDETDVHPFEIQPLKRIFKAAHRAVIAIVEIHFEAAGICPGRIVDVLLACGFQNTTHLGRQNIVIPVLPAQAMPGAQLRQPVAIHRCGVIIPDPGLPCGLEHVVGRFLVDLTENVPNWCGAESKSGNFQIHTSEFHFGIRLHTVSLQSNCLVI